MGRENRSVDAFDLHATPALSELNRALARAIKLSIRTHIPSTVVAYDPATQTAQVTVDALPVVRVTDPTRIPKNILTLKGVPPNAEAVLAPIMLSQIPVAMLSGSTGYVAIPLVPGDTGMLHVSDRSLEAWLQSGIPADPVFAFTHALKDSVFYPGLRPKAKPITPPPSGTVLEGLPTIKLGAVAVDAVIKGTTFVALMDAMITAAVAAALPITPPSGDGGTAAFTAFKTAWDAAKVSISSTKVSTE